MYATPVLGTAAAVAHAAPAARKRIVAALLSLGLALSMLLTPQFTPTASATVTVRNAATASTWANSMLNLLNYQRHANHLPRLTANTKLVLSAHRHNLTMASKNTMSHQLPGEAFFATRITAAGYKWQSAGENIGWNSVQTNTGLNDLEAQMYHETAPNNGHRLNILNRAYTQVGIDVYFDATHHKMWFTQDFGHPTA